MNKRTLKIIEWFLAIVSLVGCVLLFLQLISWRSAMVYLVVILCIYYVVLRLDFIRRRKEVKEILSIIEWVK